MSGLAIPKQADAQAVAGGAPQTGAAPAPTTSSTPAAAESAPKSSQETKTSDAAPKATPVAPERYEFKVPPGLPDGARLDDKVIAAFAETAKGANLTQEQAQRFVDSVMPTIYRRGVEMQDQMRAEWRQQMAKDAELGGDKSQETSVLVAKGRGQFDSPELRDLLDGPLGLRDHPAMIRLFAKIGRSLSEDRFVAGGGSGAVDPRDSASAARKFYKT